jgi:uncharacterized membrane protein
MCFSAAASFTAGTALTLGGIYSVSLAQKQNVRLFAAIPIAFGIQQLVEGAVWSTFGNEPLHTFVTRLYLLFAYAVWPILIPIAVYLLEGHRKRKQWLFPLMILGTVAFLYMMWYVLGHSFTAVIRNNYMGYSVTESYFRLFVPVYFITVCMSLLLSSRVLVKILSFAVLIAALIATWFFVNTFLSTWCFFSALLSLLIVAQVKLEGRNAR